MQLPLSAEVTHITTSFLKLVSSPPSLALRIAPRGTHFGDYHRVVLHLIIITLQDTSIINLGPFSVTILLALHLEVVRIACSNIVHIIKEYKLRFLQY